MRPIEIRITCVIVAVVSTAVGFHPEASASLAGTLQRSSYEELTSLFAEWRAFQTPVVVDGVPDYTDKAMVGTGPVLARRCKTRRALFSGTSKRSWTFAP